MSHPFSPNPEQESLSALRSLVIDLYERGDPETARRLPIIAYRIANAAADRQSERLLQSALDIWLMEIGQLPRAKDHTVRRPVTDLLAESAYYVIARFARQMENDYAPMKERLGALPFLVQLAGFEAEALKLHVDRRDREAFDDAYGRWSDAWFRHWSPEREVEDLNLFGAQDPEIARRLETARRLSDAKVEAMRAHSRALLELGAWIAYERRRDRMDQDDFSFFSRFLVGVFRSSIALVDELATIASERWEPGRVERWVLFSEDTQPSRRATRGWVGGLEIVAFWLALLLTRFMSSPTDVEHRPEGLADWLVDQLRGNVDAIGEQWATWQEVVRDQSNLKHAREWLNEERRRGHEAGAIRIREAPLDPDRVAEFVRAEQDSFVRGALVREQVILIGASRVEPETDPTRGLRRFPLRRDIFVAGGPMLVDSGEQGAALAREIDGAVFTALSGVASPAPGSEEPVDAIIAIAEEMVTGGLPPDAILAPASLRTRLRLSRHPRFHWRVRGVVDDPGPLGYLDALPVYDVGPEAADQLVIVSFKKALTLVERRTSTTRPIEVSISQYSADRADEVVRQGFRFSDQPDWPDDRVAATLVRDFVEASIHLDYEVVLEDDASDAARRIYIPADRDQNA
jgi:hypothetical protein